MRLSFSLFRFSTSRRVISPQIANGKKIESGKRKSVEKKEKERKAIRLFPFRLSPMLSNLIFKQTGRYLENRAKWVLRKKTQKFEGGVNDSAIWESGGSLLRTFFCPCHLAKARRWKNFRRGGKGEVRREKNLI